MTHPTRPRLPLRLPWLTTLVLPALLALAAGGCDRKGAKAYNEGQAHLTKKRYPKAIRSFEKAVQQNPGFGEAYYNLGAARFQLAIKQLGQLVASQGSPALKATLKATGSESAKADTLSPEQATGLISLTRELGRLPAARANAIVALFRQALAAKLKARALFKKGKFVVIRKSSTRSAMIAKLDEVARLKARIQKIAQGDQLSERQRGLWLVAVARPSLLTAHTVGTSGDRPRPQPRPANGAMTP